jgi:oxygen-independent coproporphyrinogen-3 oxidase
LNALGNEIHFWASHLSNCRPISLYFGGGTPSRLDLQLWPELFGTLTNSFNLVDAIEVTCEANPESLTQDLISCWDDLGINRISLGVQSFQEDILKEIGRIHDACQAYQAIENISKSRIKNWSLDLMVGLPSQSMEDWMDDLRRTVDLGAPHLSFYNLILHPGLPVTKKIVANRKMNPVDERVEADQWENDQADRFLFGVDFLEAHGYHMYELSNAARPGFECRHNRLYWQGGEWIGLGVGATGYWAQTYYRNPDDWMEYMNIWGNPVQQYPLQPEARYDGNRILDFVMLRLRTAEGYSEMELQEILSKPLSNDYHLLKKSMGEAGYLRTSLDDFQVALSPNGWLLHSEIICRLVNVING